MKKIAFIGGDARQLTAASVLRASGYDTVLYGFSLKAEEPAASVVDSLCCSSSDEVPRELAEGIRTAGRLAASAEDALADCEAVILPLPASHDGVHVSMPLAGGIRLSCEQLLAAMDAAGVRMLCGGKLSERVQEACRERGIEVFDYYGQEDFAIANAVPTAEGAIAIAMRELPITLHGADALVIGCGRIGKVLARKLHALSTHVTVSARKPSDHAWIRADGMEPAVTGQLCELLAKRHFDVIFNTVPHRVLGEAELAGIPAGGLIIDLASKPGGVDIAEAEKRTQNVIWALSLPGKVAPVTSGRIIAGTLLSRLNGG